MKEFLFNYYHYKPKKTTEKDSYKVTVNGVSQLVKWMELVGSKNPSKLSRYLIWQRFGFCPTKTTYAQRQQLLKGTLNPYSIGP